MNFLKYFLCFKYKEFVNDATNLEIRQFLDWFVKTQLFEVFLTKKSNPEQKFAQMFEASIQETNGTIQTSFKLNPVSKIQKTKNLSKLF